MVPAIQASPSLPENRQDLFTFCKRLVWQEHMEAATSIHGFHKFRRKKHWERRGASNFDHVHRHWRSHCFRFKGTEGSGCLKSIKFARPQQNPSFQHCVQPQRSAPRNCSFCTFGSEAIENGIFPLNSQRRIICQQRLGMLRQLYSWCLDGKRSKANTTHRQPPDVEACIC